jgi:hypothetical protein
MPGLDPGIHPLRKKLDCRVKPGNDERGVRCLNEEKQQFMPQDSILIAKSELTAFVTAIFQAVGLSKEHAAEWARMLVWANLRGTDSHGIIRIPRYIDLINAKSINAAPNIRVERRTAAAVVLETDRAPAAVGSAHDLAVGDDAGGEIEQIRPAVPTRHRECDRIGRHRRDSRPRIDHHRAGRAHDDARQARFRGLQGEIADGAGVREVARGAPADADLAGNRGGLSHGAGQRNGRWRAVGFEHDRGRAGFALDPDIRRGVNRLGVDEIEVARDADDAVGVGAAEVGPDQHPGPFAGVFLRQADGLKDRGDERR